MVTKKNTETALRALVDANPALGDLEKLMPGAGVEMAQIMAAAYNQEIHESVYLSLDDSAKIKSRSRTMLDRHGNEISEEKLMSDAGYSVSGGGTDEPVTAEEIYTRPNGERYYPRDWGDPLGIRVPEYGRSPGV